MSSNTKLAEAARRLDDAIKDLPDACERWLEPLDEHIAELREAIAAHDAEQAAKAVPALYVGLIERLMRLSTRLGIAYEGGVEHFAASLEDRLYAICRGAESLLNSVATPPAPEAQQAAQVGALPEPLTDDDAYRIVCEFFNQPWYRRVATEVVRATEKAHGIGATTGKEPGND